VYSCVVTLAGVAHEILWDFGKACANGTCQTSAFTVPDPYQIYADTDGHVPTTISGHSVPLGIKPIFLSP
jgi:hypothetical protein